mmetsp:Transcript_17835/g.58291  ORF Transcript_17835/g.58291 Transcript_17835/m.58291 type:complete len:267 (-) Transcript_17835:2207-3007(-)
MPLDRAERQVCRRVLKRQADRRMGRAVRELGDHPAAHRRALLLHLPEQREGREREEIVLVANDQVHLGGADPARPGHRPDGLHGRPGLHGVRVELPVGLHQPVDAEGLVRRRAGRAKVAAVAEKSPAGGVPANLGQGASPGERHAEALVGKVPDAATLQHAVRPDDAPVFGEPAARVAHGVRVLAHDERPSTAVQLVRGCVPLQLGGGRVHGHKEVGVGVDRLHVLRRPARLQPRVLVLHWPRGVAALEMRVCPVEAGPIAGLVAE